MSRPIQLTVEPGRSRRASLAATAGRPGIVMALWGLAGMAVTALVLLAITPKVWPMEDWRGIHLRAEMAVWLHGGPLLVGREGAHGAYYPVDFGDDEGVFVYIPVLTRLFGVSDPVGMVRDVYVALLSLGVLIYPTIFYRLTRSRAAGLAAPAMFLACMLSLGFVDVYWIPAWGALVLFPLIFLLARDWPRRFGLPAIMTIVLAASWLSSIRSYTGLGIAVAAAIVLMTRRWPWWRLLPALAILAVVYVSINAFVFSAVRTDRDRRLGGAAKTVNITTAHAFWVRHTRESDTFTTDITSITWTPCRISAYSTTPRARSGFPAATKRSYAKRIFSSLANTRWKWCASTRRRRSSWSRIRRRICW